LKHQIEEAVKALSANDQMRRQIESDYDTKRARLLMSSSEKASGITDPNIRSKLRRELNTSVEELAREKNARMKSELRPAEKIKVKTTVILTSVSLMGQW
jgi:hypothetical protein